MALTPATPPTGPGAADGDDELLARATRDLREAPEPGWAEISEAVVGAVRAATRHTSPVAARLGLGASADPAAPERGDTLRIADAVLAHYVGRAVGSVAGCSPVRVDLRLDDAQRCTGMGVDVAVAWDLDLPVVADHARDAAAATLAELLGDDAPGPGDVDVRVVDVTTDDR